LFGSTNNNRARRGAQSAFLLVAVACAATAMPHSVYAQEPWKKLYVDAKGAFERRDYAVAEQKFKASMDDASAPKTHGPKVLIYSQVRGFIPEYYLALIYASQKKFPEAIHYATIAEGYLKRSDAPYYATLHTASETAKLAMNAPLPAPSGTRLRGDVAVALAGGHFDDARNLVRQGQAAGATGNDVTELLRQIDREEFSVLMRDAGTARDARNFAEAARLASRARQLNVDNKQADDLVSDIANRETFTRLIADGRRALGSGQVAQARDSAQRARALSLDTGQVDALLADISRHEDFAGLMMKAQKAYDTRQFSDARQAAQQAKSLNVDNQKADFLLAGIERQQRFEADMSSARTALDANRFSDARKAVSDARLLNVDGKAVGELSRNIDVRDLAKQLETLMTSKSLAAMPPVISKLESLDPHNPAIFSARSLLTSVAGDDQKERLGIGQFYRGEYADAVTALTSLSTGVRPRVLLYLACSKAALALIERDPQKRKTLEQEARQHFAHVRDQRAAFSTDLRYVSPSIIQILDLAGS
jgi:hypothetical protein